MMPTKITVAGATGWTGQEIVKAILKSDELELTGAVARKSVGFDVGEWFSESPTGIKITASVAEALNRPTEVLIDFTSSDIVFENTLYAISNGVSVVIGTSGLDEAQFEFIADQATKNKVGVVAAGNFSITAALAKHFSLIAAKFLPQCEILDFAHAEKVDVPSGTARELAEALAKVRPGHIGLELEKLHGPKEARGADIGGTQVHSVRLPGYVLGFEAIFGMANERLILKHEAGSGAAPYVTGALLAAKRAREIHGLVRGLDSILF
jgi:4-hydroxy-tetrahydrodipicolinate reductase